MNIAHAKGEERVAGLRRAPRDVRTIVTDHVSDLGGARLDWEERGQASRLLEPAHPSAASASVGWIASARLVGTTQAAMQMAIIATR